MAPEIRTVRQVRAAVGEPPAVVRVRNLQTSVRGPSDAWQRADKPQPVSVSIAVTMNKAFGSSSCSDRVASDTVHYGLLSKAVIATLAQCPPSRGKQYSSLQETMDNIWADLVGLDDEGQAVQWVAEKPFLDISAIRCLEVTLLLPKASLLGSGVSFTKVGLFAHDDGTAAGRPTMSMLGYSLTIHDLRVPTVIGVNSNERQAKQVVVASLTVEMLDHREDAFAQMEAEAVKIIAESSFETLEALARDLSVRISMLLNNLSRNSTPLEAGWPLRIVLEKPTAVSFADASCVEVGTYSNDALNWV